MASVIRPYLILALLSVQLSTMEVVLVRGDVGTAVRYGPPYTPTSCEGNRQDQFPAGNMFAAVSQGLWNNGAACGRKYTMRCLSGNNRPCKEGVLIDVVVVDRCRNDPCEASLLLSVDAFAAISRSSGKINIEYIESGYRKG